MDWIEESRRSAFERGERIRARQRADSSEWVRITRDLDRALSEDIRLRAIAIGNELIFSYEDALAAIGIATEREIAVLGFDSGEVLEDGFQVLGYAGYDGNVRFTGNWKAYVEAMNIEAERWIKEHRLGRNHGYILTSTSQKEFDELQRWDMKQVFRSTGTRPQS
jgi:hypothetical protein